MVTIDSIESDPRIQLIMMGILMPIFVCHTYFGGQEFFNSNLTECREKYQGEVFYIVIFMFAISMCFVFALMLLCVILPTWIKYLTRRRNNRVLAQRLAGMDGLVEDFIEADAGDEDDNEENGQSRR